jgi:hypothetical protein
MGQICYFCSERERVSYFSYFCEECSLLRRILLVYSPEECIGILKRTCLRDGKQIDYKVGQEIKKIITKEIEKMPTVQEEKSSVITTRSKAH